MKFKSLFALISLLVVLINMSCDDSTSSIGLSIQPPSDSITVAADTIVLKSRTVSMLDSVYARTIYGVLGKYEDDIFGTVKSDYLCQFYFPEEARFKENLIAIDSMQFGISFMKYTGNTLAPMGLSVYKLNKPLVANYYTNADPAKFCDMTQPLVNEAYTIQAAGFPYPDTYPTLREIIAPLDTTLARNIIKASYNGTIKDTESFAKFLPGVYVTTTFGSGSLIEVERTELKIAYRYNHVKGNTAGTADTIRSATFSIAVTPEVIQLNHIKNKNADALFAENTGAAYLKAPAGVYTEIEIPIKQIVADMAKLGVDKVNSIQLNIKGFTEREDLSTSAPLRPVNLLLINKDSVESFFTKRNRAQVIDMKTTFWTNRNTTTNSYPFANISSLIEAYKDKGLETLKYLLIPIAVTPSGSTVSTTTSITGVYNVMSPTTAILRNDAKNMKIELVYSKIK